MNLLLARSGAENARGIMALMFFFLSVNSITFNLIILLFLFFSICCVLCIRVSRFVQPISSNCLRRGRFKLKKTSVVKIM